MAIKITRIQIPGATPLVRIDSQDRLDTILNAITATELDSALVLYSPLMSRGQIAGLDKDTIRDELLSKGALEAVIRPVPIETGLAKSVTKPVSEPLQLQSVTMPDPVESLKPALEARLDGDDLERAVAMVVSAFQS